MANRRLTSPEIDALNGLQAQTVAELDRLAGGDPELLFALRRRLFTRLMHLERGTPAQRTKLKAAKWKEQDGLCAMCGKELPEKGSELDRLVASKGYTPENTRLLHHDCHVADQRRKGFTDVEAEIAERLEELDEIEADRDTCEILAEGAWERIDVEDALARRGLAPMRCPVCHGPVRAHKAGTTGQRAHFEHQQRHDGCRLASGFSGAESEHPHALR